MLGRLAHVCKQGAVPLDHLRLFVMDEADRLLDGAFADEVRYGYGAGRRGQGSIAAQRALQ